MHRLKRLHAYPPLMKIMGDQNPFPLPNDSPRHLRGDSIVRTASELTELLSTFSPQALQESTAEVDSNLCEDFIPVPLVGYHITEETNKITVVFTIRVT